MINVNQFMEKHGVDSKTLAGLLGITPRTLYDFTKGKTPTRTIQLFLEKLDESQDVVGTKKMKSEINAEIESVLDKHFKLIAELRDPVVMQAKLNELIKYREAFSKLE